MSGFKKRTDCRSCSSGDLGLIHDFGPQPLAGEYPLVGESERPARKYPLDFTKCNTCGLLQVTHLPAIDDVFHEDYRYSSSTIPDLVHHFEGFADLIATMVRQRGSVLEFGCNDGVLLERLRKRGLVVSGIDASDNMAAIARGKGLDVRTGFFTAEFARESGFAGSFDAVTCSNVFAHIDDLQAALDAVRTALKPGGLFFVEVHDAQKLLIEAQFDTIYHEHLTYFGAETLTALAMRGGFATLFCEATPMHGGGLRFCGRFEPGRPITLPQAPAPIDSGLFDVALERCGSQIRALRKAYGPLHGYGAAGRSQMFINMTATAKDFAIVYDDSPFRQGRFIVGTDIPIRPYEGQSGGACVILAWNYAETIGEKLKDRFERVVAMFPDYREITVGGYNV